MKSYILNVTILVINGQIFKMIFVEFRPWMHKNGNSQRLRFFIKSLLSCADIESLNLSAFLHECSLIVDIIKEGSVKD